MVEGRRRTTRSSSVQPVAGIVGVASLVLGGVAIARTGLSTDHLFSPQRSVATLHHTPLLALSELAFGVLMIWAASRTRLGRSVMALLGLAVLGLGVVTIADIWPAQLHHWLGVTHRNGWLFVLVGGLSFLVAMFIPTVRTRGKVVGKVPAAPAKTSPADEPADATLIVELIDIVAGLEARIETLEAPGNQTGHKDEQQLGVREPRNPTDAGRHNGKRRQALIHGLR